VNDQADPNQTTLFGDTPGSLGMNDHADPSLPYMVSLSDLIEGKMVCSSKQSVISVALTGLGKEEIVLKSTEDVTLAYSGSIAKLPEKAEKILKDICRDADIEAITITSTTRTPEDQARIMYDNIVSYGVSKQKELYGPAGDKIIDEYVALKKAGKSEAEIKAGMKKKILEVGPQKVSRHCADSSEKCVCDVAPSSIPAKKKMKFETAVGKNKSVLKFLRPPSDPAYHIEIKLK
jgi:hypothetical protein